MSRSRHLFAALLLIALGAFASACGDDDALQETPAGEGGAGGSSGGSGGGAPGGAGGGGGGGGTISGCTSDLECPARLPTCHEGRCVACVDDLGCDTATPVCGADGTCGACTADAACTGREGAGRCVEGGCVQCRGSTDCAAPTPVCSPVNTCVECVADADCGDGTCVLGACQHEIGCLTNADCGDPLLLCVTFEGAQTGRCEELCAPELGGPCVAGQRCALVGFGDAPDFQPIGVCLDENGGGDVGAVCDAGGAGAGRTCEADRLCVTATSGATEGACSQMCDSSQDLACPEGLRCVDLDVPTPAGATIGVCLDRPEPCATDADCAPDELCSITTASAGEIALGCVPMAGAKRGGERCVADAECGSSLCILGVCYGSCEASIDCSGGAECLEVTFNLADGSQASTPICLAGCVDDAGCGAGLTCQLALHRPGDRLVRVCGNAQGAVEVGGACARDEQCRTGTCLRGTVAGVTTGVCTGFCDDDLDCGPLTCVGTAYQYGPGADGSYGTADDWHHFDSCRGAPCGADADCANGWACGVEYDGDDPTLTSVAGRCVPPQGVGHAGTACAAGADCRSGVCVDAGRIPEDCANGLDDDGDGRADCADPKCFTVCFTERDCHDGLDDDGDGAIDCVDGDCNSTCGYEQLCRDGVDQDLDGRTDCDDPDCQFDCGLYEFECADGLDEDRDGRTDCDDPDCEWSGFCQELVCDDGLDDDGDGFVDCQDDDCRWGSACQANGWEGDGNPLVCSNGTDDDQDGLTDCADPGCAGIGACAESGCTGADCCGDGVDQDGDGAIDCADDDCHEDPRCNERGECTGGVDDDGDLAVDCHDPDCAADPACNEANCAGGDCCANGLDDDGDGAIDCADYACAYTAACYESFCVGGGCCGDGLDSDADGFADCDDTDCQYDSRCYEWTCDDGRDDDGDGLVDCADTSCFDNAACRLQRFTCFEACAADADCPATLVCLTGAAGFATPTTGRYDYVGTCGLPPCAPGADRCGGDACLDLQTDAANCGACGTACATGASCEAGGCLCPLGTEDCGAGACEDVLTNPLHCGACGVVCDPATQQCLAGGCVAL